MGEFDGCQRGSIRAISLASVVKNPDLGQSIHDQILKRLRTAMRTWDPPIIKKRTRKSKQPLVSGQGRKHFGDAHVNVHNRVRMPDDMQDIVNAPNRVLEADDHVFDQIVPHAEHSETTWYVENLDVVLVRWEKRPRSPNKAALPRWEFYTPVGKDVDGNGLWYLVVIEGGHGGGGAKIVARYSVKESSVTTRSKSTDRDMRTKGEK